MRVKKVISLMMAVVMTLGLVTACGADSSSSTGNTTTNETKESTKTSGSNKKVLVVYYSATGR